MINDLENQGEIWKDVVGFEDLFSVSSLGRIFSKRTSRILKTFVNGHGYNVVSTRVGGRQGKAYCFKIHRLVAHAFLPVPNELDGLSDSYKYKVLPVNHKDSDKLNNIPDNLEWCTYSHNSTHYIESGNYRPKKGHLSPSSRFSLEQRKDIYSDWIKTRVLRKTARNFNTTHYTVSRIIKEIEGSSIK